VHSEIVTSFASAFKYAFCFVKIICWVTFDQSFIFCLVMFFLNLHRFFYFFLHQSHCFPIILCVYIEYISDTTVWKFEVRFSFRLFFTQNCGVSIKKERNRGFTFFKRFLNNWFTELVVLNRFSLLLNKIQYRNKNVLFFCTDENYLVLKKSWFCLFNFG